MSKYTLMEYAWLDVAYFAAASVSWELFWICCKQNIHASNYGGRPTHDNSYHRCIDIATHILVYKME